MSLFGALYIGDSGLRTSQNALNTVAHNLSNINTPGYVRQQVSQSDTTYSNSSTNRAGKTLQIGDGVKYSDCRHIRDAFLDAAYREESGRYSYYEVSYSAILEIEDIMGEFADSAFSDSVSALWSSIQELSKHPNDPTNISLFVQKSAIFAENSTAVYQSFVEYQNNLNRQVKNAVADINSIGERIVELNKQIMRIESGGVEGANDLRDERDLLLDTLAGYGNIKYEENVNTSVTVWFNGVNFVNETTMNKMEMLTDDESGFVTPYWPHNTLWITDKNGQKVQDFESAKVFNLTEKISMANGTDMGSLRALLLARGDHSADYTDLAVDVCTQRKLDALGITKEQYNAEYGKKYYNDYIANSVMMNVMGEFDNLVNNITTRINRVLAENCDPVSGYLCNKDGSPIQMFEKLSGSGYEKVMLSDKEYEALKAEGALLIPICDEKGNVIPNNYWKYIEEDPSNAFSLYTCSNLKINQDLLQTPMLLGFLLEDDSADFNIGKALVEEFANEDIYLNPNATKKSSFESCYTDLMSQVSSGGNTFKLLYEYEQLAVEQAENERQTVIGVSHDEELEHMIMFQNAYNAASRYINVVNSMLDTLLSMAR